MLRFNKILNSVESLLYRNENSGILEFSVDKLINMSNFLNMGNILDFLRSNKFKFGFFAKRGKIYEQEL